MNAEIVCVFFNFCYNEIVCDKTKFYVVKLKGTKIYNGNSKTISV